MACDAGDPSCSDFPDTTWNRVSQDPSFSPLITFEVVLFPDSTYLPLATGHGNVDETAGVL